MAALLFSRLSIIKKMNLMKKKVSLILGILIVLVFPNISFATPTCPTGSNPENGICIPDEIGLPNPGGGVSQVITNVMMWLTGILAAIAIIGFVISGMQYLLSAGDDKRMETAKRNMTYCIIGVVVGISGYIIIFAIDSALRGNTNW
jgi:hypothetical protein